MAVAEYIGDGSPDGTCVFQSGEKGGFFGLASPVVQPTGVTKVTTGGAEVSTANTRVAVNAIITQLVALGLFADLGAESTGG